MHAKKYIISIVVALFWAAISIGAFAAPACPAITRALYRGHTDRETEGQVTVLQQFLAEDPAIYPERLVTGYLGPLTEKAIQRWQKARGVVSAGSPSTTGYGVVGPKNSA